MQRDLHKTRGFTLVELLVVIGIIALLISILLPALNAVRNQSKTLACAANLRTVGQALEIYIGDNKCYPYAYINSNKTKDLITNPSGTNFNWANTLAASLFHSKTIEAYSNTTNGRMQAFLCPSRKVDVADTSHPITTYCVHPIVFGGYHLGSADSSLYPYPFIGSYVYVYKASWMHNASEKVIVFDGAQQTNYDIYGNMGTVASPALWMITDAANTRYFQKTGFTDNQKYYFVARSLPDQAAYVVKNNIDDNGQNVNGSNDYMKGYAAYRHGPMNQSNMLFADGHVQTSRMEKATFRTDLTVRNFHVYFPLTLQ